jgi:hypothetical protein
LRASGSEDQPVFAQVDVERVLARDLRVEARCSAYVQVFERDVDGLVLPCGVDLTLAPRAASTGIPSGEAPALSPAYVPAAEVVSSGERHCWTSEGNNMEDC